MANKPWINEKLQWQTCDSLTPAVVNTGTFLWAFTWSCFCLAFSLVRANTYTCSRMKSATLNYLFVVFIQSKPLGVDAEVWSNRCVSARWRLFDLTCELTSLHYHDVCMQLPLQTLDIQPSDHKSVFMLTWAEFLCWLACKLFSNLNSLFGIRAPLFPCDSTLCTGCFGVCVFRSVFSCVLEHAAVMLEQQWKGYCEL